MANRSTSGECVYCGRIGPLTDDHVPPRSFFPDPPPPQLITVPSCARCNRSFAIDDDYVRLVLTIDQRARGNRDRNMVLPRAVRSSQRRESRRTLTPLFDSLGWDYRLNDQGVYVRAQRYTVEVGRLDRFATRAIKALFYREKGHRLADDHRVNAIHPSRWPTIQGDAREFLEWITAGLQTMPAKSWGTTFAYRWVQSPNGPSMTWWLLELYGTPQYVCSTSPRQ